MSDNMKAELVNKALLMAIWGRKPKRGLLWRTDKAVSMQAAVTVKYYKCMVLTKA